MIAARIQWVYKEIPAKIGRAIATVRSDGWGSSPATDRLGLKKKINIVIRNQKKGAIALATNGENLQCRSFSLQVFEPCLKIGVRKVRVFPDDYGAVNLVGGKVSDRGYLGRKPFGATIAKYEYWDHCKCDP